MATVNVGAADTITASADTGGVPLPVNIALCQTNQMTGACLGTPATTVSTAVAASATPTFGIFVTGTNNVAPLPGANRIFVRFKDHLGNSVGATGVAAQTQGYHPALPPALTFSVPDPLPNGTVNQDYGGSPDGVSLCSPRPANSTTAPCVPDPSNPFSPTAPGANPQGGSPPYHCQLDSGVGFPPIGISLTKDCFLKGKPTATGTATFKVCAVDLNGSQVCQPTHIAVVGAAGTETWTGTFTGTYIPFAPYPCTPIGKFAESGTITMQFQAGLLGLLGLSNVTNPGPSDVTGSWTVTETTLQASCFGRGYPTSYTVQLSMGSSVGADYIQLYSASQPFVPVGVAEEIVETAVALVPTSVNSAGTMISGQLQLPTAQFLDGGKAEAFGTFTITKQ